MNNIAGVHNMSNLESATSQSWTGLCRALCGLFAALLLLPAVSYAADTECAKVKIEIQQKLTMERQGFDAMMKINNGLTTASPDNVNINVKFTDDAGNSVVASSDPNNTTAAFFISVDTMTD